MKSFKQHISEAAEKPLPSDVTATKLRNAIIKRFGGKTLSNWDSNPYSDTQSLDAMKVKGKDLIKALEAEGWKDDSGMRINGAKSFVKDSNMVTIYKTNSITVYGKKKAKPSTLPYYD
jgi:predicted RNA binding protein YcfA (HicA-like mRNA interferase family)